MRLGFASVEVGMWESGNIHVFGCLPAELSQRTISRWRVHVHPMMLPPLPPDDGEVQLLQMEQEKIDPPCPPPPPRSS